MTKTQNYQWLVLGGCPRSGTTMLNFIINSHPNIFIANEQNLFKTIQISEQLFHREDCLKNRILRELSPREKAIGRYEDEKIKATIHRKLSQKAIITCLFSSSLVREPPSTGTVYLGDKYPTYYHWEHKLIENILGPLKYIHITRSPVSVINSNLFRSQMTKQGKDWVKPGQVYIYIAEWIKAWNFICGTNQNYFLHLRYEDAIASPRRELDRISQFLGVQPVFDASKIVKTHIKREYISAPDMKAIQKYIPEELVEWETPLEELIKKYPKIEFLEKSTLKQKINSIPKLFWRTQHPTPDT